MKEILVILLALGNIVNALWIFYLYERFNDSTSTQWHALQQQCRALESTMKRVKKLENA